MAQSETVLKAVLDDLAPKYGNLFQYWDPIQFKIIESGNMERGRLKGPRKKFRVVTGGPGRATKIATGGEDYTAERKQIVERGTAEATRIVYTFYVPAKDLAEAPEGEQGLDQILKEYPEFALTDVKQRVAEQMALGAQSDGESGYEGILTFDGTKTYTPDDTAYNGLFDLAPKASQTGSALGLTKEAGSGGVPGWYNGYGSCTSLSGDGVRELRLATMRANRRARVSGAKLDLMMSNDLAWANYVDLMGDKVIVRDTLKGESGAEDDREGVKFLNAIWYPSQNFDEDSALVTGSNGYLVGLSSGTWHCFTLGSDAKMETNGDFAFRGPYKHPTKDGWNYEIVVHMGHYTDNLSANYVFEGLNVL